MKNYILLIFISFNLVSKAQQNIKLRLSTDVIKDIIRYSNKPNNSFDWYYITPLKNLFWRNKSNLSKWWGPILPPSQLHLGFYIEADINDKIDFSLGIRDGFVGSHSKITLYSDSLAIGSHSAFVYEGGPLIRFPLQISYKLWDLRKVVKIESGENKPFSNYSKQHRISLISALTPGWQPKSTSQGPSSSFLFVDDKDTISINEERIEEDNKFGVGFYLGLKWTVYKVMNNKEILSLMFFYEQGFLNYISKEYYVVNTFRNERHSLVTKSRGSQLSLMISFPITLWRKKEKA